MTYRFGPAHPDATYVPHGYPEQAVDLGEVTLNYAAAGPEDAPALLLVPGQTLSWWTYEPVMRRLASDFRVYAVDLRGQGRSTRTPGRYTLDLWSGAATAGCDHARMLAGVKFPVLFTHHFRGVDAATGMLQGAVSDVQVDQVRRLVEGAGQAFTYRSFPQAGHALYAEDPDLYAATLRDRARSLA